MESEERSAPGVLFLIQLAEFAGYNQAYGRERGRPVAGRIAVATAGMPILSMQHAGSFAGRRGTGAEFAVFLPGVIHVPMRVIWCRQLVE